LFALAEGIILKAMESGVYLSVVIPAYNEAKRITKTLQSVSDYLKKQPFAYEILVVNDGSTDKTADVVKAWAERIDNLSLIDRRENKGKGFTVKEGMLASKGKIRLFMDADNSTDISHFEKMKPFFDNGYDVVIGSRDSKDVKGAKQAVPQPFIKRILGNLGNIIIQILVIPGIWDTQAGFKAFRDYAAEKVFKKITVNGWAFDIEALAIARKLGYKIGIIPLFWVNDPKSHVKISGYIEVFFQVFKIRWNLWAGKYFG
jgi:dolichyl-phosphate beta-glucosyltransferase